MNIFKLFSLYCLVISPGVSSENKALDVLKHLQLPPGFSISIYADNVTNARTMAISENGIVYVGTRQQGTVYALEDSNHDGFANKRYIIASQLYMPNGVAYKDGDLYIAETNRIIRLNNIDKQLANPPKATIVYDRLPSDSHHGWKYLRFGPDNKLYTAIGAPCNICLPTKGIYTSLVRLDKNGNNFEIIARGIRNSVGFDWQPNTNKLFFSENGRDHLGDNLPPDELNIWTKKGQYFGYPYCHAKDIADPKLAANKKCTEFTAPAWEFSAHKAPLGMMFYTGKQFPLRFKNQLLVAQHGSWNRSKPHGYQVVLLKLKDGKVISEQSFISGWLTKDDDVLGRPTDIVQMADGSILIADDTLGVIYRVTYKTK